MEMPISTIRKLNEDISSQKIIPPPPVPLSSSMTTTTSSNITQTHNPRKKRKPAYGTRKIGRCMRIEKIVGSGTFGLVFKAIEIESGESVALKKIKMERETSGFPITAIREIKILNQLKHENIVDLREIVTYNEEEKDVNDPSTNDKGFSDGDVFMVFEFVDYDLSGLLKSPGIALSEAHIKSFLQQLLRGVKFLHDHSILHRDIKTANLLITANNVLKIADWGLARSFNSNNKKMTTPVVTLWYRSPELILGNKYYGTEVDIWSVGCIFGEMRSKVAMFRGEHEALQFDLILTNCGRPSESVLDYYKTLPDWEKINFHANKVYTPSLATKYLFSEPDAIDLLMELLCLDPRKRISARDALDHPYFHRSPVCEPQALSKFNIEPVTEWMEQERVKKEREANKQLTQNSSNGMINKANTAQIKNGMNTVGLQQNNGGMNMNGRGGDGMAQRGNFAGRFRGRGGSTKFKIVKKEEK